MTRPAAILLLFATLLSTNGAVIRSPKGQSQQAIIQPSATLKIQHINGVVNFQLDTGWTFTLLQNHILGTTNWIALTNGPCSINDNTINNYINPTNGWQITYGWNQSKDPTVVAYNLYWWSNGVTNRVSDIPYTNTMIQVIFPKAGTYTAAATTQNSSGVQSPFSNTVTTNAFPIVSKTKVTYYRAKI